MILISHSFLDKSKKGKKTIYTTPWNEQDRYFFYGFMVLWFSGSLVLWFSGFKVLWFPLS